VVFGILNWQKTVPQWNIQSLISCVCCIYTDIEWYVIFEYNLLPLYISSPFRWLSFKRKFFRQIRNKKKMIYLLSTVIFPCRFIFWLHGDMCDWLAIVCFFSVLRRENWQTIRGTLLVLVYKPRVIWFLLFWSHAAWCFW